MDSVNRKTVIQRLSSKAIPPERAGLSRGGNSRQASAARASASNSGLLPQNSAIPLALLRDVEADESVSGNFSKRGQHALVAGSSLHPAYFSLEEKNDRLSAFHQLGFSPSPEASSNKQRLFTQLLQDSNSSGLIRFLRRRKGATGSNLQSHSGVQRKPLRLGLAHSREQKPFEDSLRRTKQGKLIPRPEIVLCEVKLGSRPQSKHWPGPQPASSDRANQSKRGLLSNSQLSTVNTRDAAGIRYRIDKGWNRDPTRGISAANKKPPTDPPSLHSKPTGNSSLTVERSRSSRRDRQIEPVSPERDCPSPFPARKRQDSEESGKHLSLVQVSLPLINTQKTKKPLELGRNSRHLAPKTDLLTMRRAAAKKRTELLPTQLLQPSTRIYREQALRPPTLEQQQQPQQLAAADDPPQQLLKASTRERRSLIPKPQLLSSNHSPPPQLHFHEQLSGWSRPALHLDHQDLDFDDLSLGDRSSH